VATTHRILTHSTSTQKRYGYTGDGEVADLEVVLKKNCLLLLTVPPHSHHCRSRPTRVLSSDGQAVEAIRHSTTRVNGKGREVADLDVVLKKEHPLVLILSFPLHHCRDRPGQTHSTPTVFS
jgi:hypothetical protein